MPNDVRASCSRVFLMVFLNQAIKIIITDITIAWIYAYLIFPCMESCLTNAKNTCKNWCRYPSSCLERFMKNLGINILPRSATFPCVCLMDRLWNGNIVIQSSQPEFQINFSQDAFDVLIFCQHPSFINKSQECSELSSNVFNPFQRQGLKLCCFSQQKKNWLCISNDWLSILSEAVSFHISWVDIRRSSMIDLV